MVSPRSKKPSSASAMIRPRSSEGWEEKSNSASVLMAERRVITSAVLMRRLSRNVRSSARRASIASKGSHLAALEAADGGIEDLDSPRHLEADQRPADVVGEWRLSCRHRARSDPGPAVGRRLRRSRWSATPAPAAS